MKDFSGGVIVGYLLCVVIAVFFWPNTDSYKLGQEVQKVIDVCEEKLPRNEKCTFIIVPERKLIYDEEKSDE